MTPCVDAASEYCPCHLAAERQCIVCPPCNGNAFCRCMMPTGSCVYQELVAAGGRPRPLRGTLECEVQRVIIFDENVFHVRVKVPHALAVALTRPGSFVFVRCGNSPFYDTPISILFSEICTDSISFAVIAKGIKTMQFSALKSGDTIFLRGPYWNGVLGQEHLSRQNEGNALVLSRGIGFLPSVSVIQDLRMRNNRVSIFLDPATFNQKLLTLFQQLFEIEVQPVAILDRGGLTDEAKTVIQAALDDDVNLIHIGGSDYLIYKVLSHLNMLGRTEVRISCCNNAKMCCGEGICGACTEDVPSGKVRRLCKEQMDPYEILRRNFS